MEEMSLIMKQATEAKGLTKWQNLN
jgi:hypothetical protein